MGAGWNAWVMRHRKTHTSPERKRWDALFPASDPPAYAEGLYGSGMKRVGDAAP